MPTGRAQETNPKRMDALVIEDDEYTRIEVVTALERLGLTVHASSRAGEGLAAIETGSPKLIFLDIALEQSDAVDVIKGLGARHYPGTVQLFSSHPRLLDAIQRIALRYKLKVRPPIAKPLDPETIAHVVAEVGLGRGKAAAHPAG